MDRDTGWEFVHARIDHATRIVFEALQS